MASRGVALGFMAVVSLWGCGSSSIVRGATGSSSGGTSSSGSTGLSGTSGHSTGTSGVTSSSGGTTGTSMASDFPSQAVLVGGLPSYLPGLFAADGGSAGGPCLSEPTLDALVPRNWTPLHFEWAPTGTENVFELRLHVANQVNDLVVYTSSTSYELDGAVWSALESHSAGQDVQISLRGASLVSGALTSGPDTGAMGAIHLSTAEAAGAVVYWTSSDGTAFKGFSVGADSAGVVLTPSLAGATSNGSATNCVACHASSPDGKLVLYTRDDDAGTRALDARQVGDAGAPDPSQVSPAALQLLGRNRQFAPVTSAAHYGPGDAKSVSIFQNPDDSNLYDLIWTNLQATDTSSANWGVIARTGDGRQAASPSWRHDGTAVAYVSAPSVGEGVISDVTAADPDYDIYVVPYNDGAGGAAAPLAGASDPAYREFYPVYSPGDSLIAFTRHDQAANSYNQPASEVCVVPSNGGTATRLRANDPPACTGLVSPGLTNSWPRWAPQATQIGNERVYWMVFSSKRHASSVDGNGAMIPQLYVAGVVTQVRSDGSEVVEHDYPALYVRSQNPEQSNHTPAWDVFQLEFQ
ncbi:MAG: hypothetical protein JST54_07320 [Deltaproteobacteria bacterium]|nr:hypothetical protein [Deltaproteobacteria bacterium]